MYTRKGTENETQNACCFHNNSSPTEIESVTKRRTKR